LSKLRSLNFLEYFGPLSWVSGTHWSDKESGFGSPGCVGGG
jgi:hypothetical protein